MMTTRSYELSFGYHKTISGTLLAKKNIDLNVDDVLLDSKIEI